MSVLLAALTACGPPPGAAPDPAAVVPGLFEPSRFYRDLGLLASDPPLAFVGSVRFLATASPETTLAFVAVSFASEQLAFRRAASGYEARYTAEILVTRRGEIAARQRTRERVRVATRDETRRADESVVFQQVLRLAPGRADVTVSLRDEEAGAVGRAEQTVTVPRFDLPDLSGPVPVHDVRGRATLDEPPLLLVNPRATAAYGLDTLRFYVEVYGAADAGPVRVALHGPGGEAVAVREGPIESGDGFGWSVVAFEPDVLPVGELSVTVAVPGVREGVGGRAVVTFSDQWTVTNFDDVLSLLRYFGYRRELAALAEAAPADRPGLWRAFWEASDPNPVTPRNEALERYFERMQEANRRFAEAGQPGWTTERGEVLITLGEPDEVFEASAEFQGRERTIRWTYLAEQVTLDFVDDTGFGRFRLTPWSRAEFERARNLLREGS